jgi:hypothetical protein
VSEYKGKAGRIYTEVVDDDDIDEGGKKWEVWFEDFCILGLGHTEQEVLEDAIRHTEDLSTLISEALVSLSVAAAGVSGGN